MTSAIGFRSVGEFLIASRICLVAVVSRVWWKKEVAHSSGW
jgi:hypothetical protein